MSVDTVALTKSFGWGGSEVFQQQDVQELCRVLFDALEECFKGTDMENVIDDLYAGELVDYVKCIDIDYSSERRDKFLDYSLAIRPFGSDCSMKSLTECIEHYLEPEILDGDNKYFAESVGRKVDAIKGLKFSKLPHIMSVQLKRFVYDFSGETIIQKKINDRVTFPMVLDMNKYVSTRRKRSLSFVSECSDHTGNQEEPDELDEFEKFLKKRITSLRAGQSADAKAHAPEADGDSGSVDDTELCMIHAASVQDTCDPFEGKWKDGSSCPENSPINIPVVSKITVNKGTDSNGLYDDYYSVPDLVDCNGSLHPDQKGAARTNEGPITPPSSPTGVINPDSVNFVDAEEEVQELDAQTLLRERGEWVYELYAVLVHSGAIAGGHYYVYIKDLDTNKWWNFNDSLVDEISEKEVREAWGGGTQTRVNYYGTKTTIESCANAYMLMYRKVTPIDAPSPLSPPSGALSMLPGEAAGKPAGSNGSLFPSDDMVPEYIRKEVTELLEAAEQKRKEEEERFNKLCLKIHWKGKVYPITTMRQKTYKQLLQQVWEELNVVSGVEGADDNEDFSDLEDPSIVPLDRVRLRVYNAYHKFAQEPFNVETKGDLSLEAIRISSYRELVVEVKGVEDVWEVYESDGFNLQLNQYDPETEDFKAPVSMRLPRTATLGDLRQRLAKLCPFGVENIRFLKLSLWSYAEVKSEELRGDTLKLVSEFRLYDGQKIYWEEDSRCALNASPSVKAFTTQSNRLNVMVSLPGSSVCDQTVTVDRRWNIKQFREKLSSQFSIPADSFRIFRKASVEAELNGDAMQSLFSLGIYNGLCLSLTEGSPLQPGHYLFKIYLYKATNRVGFVDLSLPSDEDTDIEKETNSDVASMDESPPDGAFGTPHLSTDVTSDVVVATAAEDVSDVPVADAEMCTSTRPVDFEEVGLVLEGEGTDASEAIAEGAAKPLVEMEGGGGSEEAVGDEMREGENDIPGFGYKMVR